MIIVIDAATGLDQPGGLQRVPGQQHRRSAPIRGQVAVGLSPDQRAHGYFQLADKNLVAEPDIEPRSERRIDRDPPAAIGESGHRFEIRVGFEPEFTVKRVVPIDALQLDAQEFSVPGTEHRVKFGDQRDLAALTHPGQRRPRQRLLRIDLEIAPHQGAGIGKQPASNQTVQAAGSGNEAYAER